MVIMWRLKCIARAEKRASFSSWNAFLRRKKVGEESTQINSCLSICSWGWVAVLDSWHETCYWYRVHCNRPVGWCPGQEWLWIGPLDPGMGATGAQYEIICKGPPSHDCHLLLEQELWIQEQSQIAHRVCLGQCNPFQHQRPYEW